MPTATLRALAMRTREGLFSGPPEHQYVRVVCVMIFMRQTAGVGCLNGVKQLGGPVRVPVANSGSKVQVDLREQCKY